MPGYDGKFAVPPVHTVEVVFHRSGLEQYKVDGQVALSSRAWEYVGVRDFKAGDRNVRVRFSLARFYCKAYIDGRLAVRDVFPRLKDQRDKIRRARKKGQGRNPFWVSMVFGALSAYILLNVLAWVTAR